MAARSKCLSFSSVLGDGQPRSANVFLCHRDGHRVPVRVSVRRLRSPTGEVVGAVETFTDISPLLAVQRRAAELERMAFIDSLTGLANRTFGERQLENHLAEQSGYGRPFGLLLLDVDHFKIVNDTWGHETGDAVLRAVGRTLSAAARSSGRTREGPRCCSASTRSSIRPKSVDGFASSFRRSGGT